VTNAVSGINAQSINAPLKIQYVPGTAVLDVVVYGISGLIVHSDSF